MRHSPADLSRRKLLKLLGARAAVLALAPTALEHDFDRTMRRV
jgi:hypothetical protein